MSDDTDIVARLRAVLHNDRSVELMNREAADEIERLRTGGCARDQRLTQYCAEAAAMQAELAACRIAYEQAIRDRDAARLAYCRDVWRGVGDEDEQRQLSPREIARDKSWPWPIPGAKVSR